MNAEILKLVDAHVLIERLDVNEWLVLHGEFIGECYQDEQALFGESEPHNPSETIIMTLR